MTSSGSGKSESPKAANHYYKVRDPNAPDWFLRIFGTLFAVGILALLIHVIQLVTATVRTAEREQLLGGLQGFTSTILIAIGGLILATVVIRIMVGLFGSFASRAAERQRLTSASRQARQSIGRKQELLEERIRLAAQLRATWLYERECYSLANAQARREFKEALQTSVTRSCEIAFDQIGLVIDQYERTLKEIDASALEAADKTELLDKLTEQLNVAATQEKNRSAERLMDDEIWKLRFETVSRLRKKSRTAALRYLQDVESNTSPCPNRRKAQAMIRRLQSKTQVENPEHH